MPGVVDVVTMDRAVAVIAEGWWRARQALDALDPEFDDGDPAVRDAASLTAAQDLALESGEREELFAAGDVAEAFSRGHGKLVEATYRTPWLHHGAMEPINVTAQFADGRLTVWAGEQDALGTKAQLMELSGLGADDVEFHGLAAGGAFGRRIPPSADYTEHVVALARAASPRPVKLILHREEEFTHGTYRPALATRISATLGEDGLPVAWSQTFLVGPTRNEGFALPYRIPNQSLRSVHFGTHLGPARGARWRTRSIPSGPNPSSTSSLMPPDAILMNTVAPCSRKARAKGACSTPRPSSAGGTSRSRQAWAAASRSWKVSARSWRMSSRSRWKTVCRRCGAYRRRSIAEPSSIRTRRASRWSAIVMGLSAAMREEITLADGVVTEQGFNDYPIFTMADPPRIDITFLKSDGPWAGVGEPGLPPAAPALVNAVFAATGERHRTLPIVRRAAEA